MTDNSALRGARAGGTSAQGATGNVIIKTTDQIDPSLIKSATVVPNSLFVSLKSDKVGVTPEQRQTHVNTISQLCRKYNLDESGRPFAGIEVRFEEVLPGYLGHFHPKMEEAIRADTVGAMACLEQHRILID